MSRRRIGEIAARVRVVFALAFGCLVATGCGAVAMYPGPRRPDPEVSVIEGRSVRVVDVDRAEVPQGSRYAVLPGEHMLLLGPDGYFAAASPEGAVRTRVCLRMLPGHAYVVRQSPSAGDWQPEVFDAESLQVVATWNANPAMSRCPPRPSLVAMRPIAAASSQRPDREEPPSGAGGAPAQPPLLPSESAELSRSSVDPGGGVSPAAARPRNQIADSGDDAPPVLPSERAESPLQPIAQPNRGAIDKEAPRYYRHRTEGRADGRVVAHPGSGVGILTGLAFGGDKLATATFSNGSTDDLSAGDGFFIELAGAFTPLWVGRDDAVGFGFGGEVGVKYGSIGDSSVTISLTRFPTVLYGQMVAPTGTNGSFILRAGVEKDLGVDFGGDGPGGSASVSLTSSAGFMAEMGSWYQFNQVSAMVITARFTHIRYSASGGSVDGSSGALMWGFLFGSAR